MEPKAQGQRSIQIDGLCVRAYCTKDQTAGDQHGLVFWELWRQASKGGPGIIDCLRRAHRAALSLELLGMSH